MSALIPQCYQNIKLLYKNFSVFFLCVCFFIRLGPKMYTRTSHITFLGTEAWTLSSRGWTLDCCSVSSAPPVHAGSLPLPVSGTPPQSTGGEALAFDNKDEFSYREKQHVTGLFKLFQSGSHFRTRCRHSPPCSNSQRDRVLHCFRDHCWYDDGKGNLLNLNP